jgi:hypothetical protein
MLNSTLVATERAMCCVIENYQTKCANGRAHRPPTAQPLAWHAAWHSMRTAGGPPPPQWRGVLTHRSRCIGVRFGIKVPEVLQPFMGGVSFIPFVATLPAPKKGPAPPQYVPTPAQLAEEDQGKAELQAYMNDKVLPTLNTALNTLAKMKERPDQPIVSAALPARPHLGRSPSPWPLALTLPARPHRARSPCLLAAVRRPSVAKCRRCRNDAGGMAAARE